MVGSDLRADRYYEADSSTSTIFDRRKWVQLTRLSSSAPTMYCTISRLFVSLVRFSAALRPRCMTTMRFVTAKTSGNVWLTASPVVTQLGRCLLGRSACGIQVIVLANQG